MTDLTTYVPDTSKYTDPADRLIALGLAMKAGRQLQRLGRQDDSWVNVPSGCGSQWISEQRMANVMAEVDYRAKPEPLVVWVNFYAGNLSPAFHYASEEEARRNVNDSPSLIAAAVRVELPE